MDPEYEGRAGSTCQVSRAHDRLFRARDKKKRIVVVPTSKKTALGARSCAEFTVRNSTDPISLYSHTCSCDFVANH